MPYGRVGFLGDVRRMTGSFPNIARTEIHIISAPVRFYCHLESEFLFHRHPESL
jgi:hypothetical protein